RHPLQPFSPRYFQGDAVLVSYAETLCEASRRAAGARDRRAPFLSGELPEPPDEWRQVSVEQFLRFFDHPVRALARERLGIRLEEGEGPLETREPFTLGPLESHQLRQRLVEGALETRSADETAAAIRGGGLLPHGQVGEILLGRTQILAEAFARQVAARHSTAGRPPCPVELELFPIRLRGQIGELFPEGRFVYRCGKIRVKDRLRLWITHLLLDRAAPPDLPRQSRLLAEDGMLCFGAVEEAERLLRHLATLYWNGCRRCLPLFPETSYAFALRLCKDGDRAMAFKAARAVWAENEFTGRGEATDPYHRLVVRRVDPLDDEFAALAEALFFPLFAHQVQE
ncbi:MAG: hypothetical protein WC713_12805, partial [Candidatus Methylomirabilota bacterium]